MIRIRYRKEPERIYFTAEGHADLKRQKFLFFREKDVLCCAVSALIQNWEASIRALAKADMEDNEKNKKGYYSVSVCRNRESDLLTQSLILGLGLLAEQYKSNITITTEESDGS